MNDVHLEIRSGADAFEDTSAKHAAARKIISAAKHHDIEVDKTSDVAKPIKR